MPHKYNANRRAKIPKQKHLVTNCAEYNEGLRRRGNLTVWISDEALGMWSAARPTTRGGQPRYSDLAIELCLTWKCFSSNRCARPKALCAASREDWGLRSQCQTSQPCLAGGTA